MFTTISNTLDTAELTNPVSDTGGFLQFYSYILDTTIQFEAFLTAYSDSFNSNWNSENVYGRMDPIYTFQNTQRGLNVGFTVPNVIHPKGSNTTVSQAMDKINKFFQFLYPEYQSTGNALTISQAPLVRVRFGNMIANSVKSSIGTAKENGLLVTINSISMDPKIEHGFSRFEDEGAFEGGTTLIYPNFIDLTLSMSVIHEQGRFGAPTQSLATADYLASGFVPDVSYSGEPADNFAQSLLEGLGPDLDFPYGSFGQIADGAIIIDDHSGGVPMNEFVGVGTAQILGPDDPDSEPPLPSPDLQAELDSYDF